MVQAAAARPKRFYGDASGNICPVQWLSQLRFSSASLSCNPSISSFLDHATQLRSAGCTRASASPSASRALSVSPYPIVACMYKNF